MLIKELKLKNYRNYTNYLLDFNPNLNIIIGKNGIGKTNILESIIVISNTKSFRTLNDKDLIKKEEEYLTIEWISQHQEDPDFEEEAKIEVGEEIQKKAIDPEEAKIKAKELQEKMRKMHVEKQKERTGTYKICYICV